MLGLVVGFRGLDVSSNREAGKKGILLEFKTCEKPEDLTQTAEDALTQIQDKRYTSAFKTGEILCIGIAFCGKELRYSWKILTF